MMAPILAGSWPSHHVDNAHIRSRFRRHAAENRPLSKSRRPALIWAAYRREAMQLIENKMRLAFARYDAPHSTISNVPLNAALAYHEARFLQRCGKSIRARIQSDPVD